MEIIEGTRPASWLVMLYGRPGIGKSTFASWAPKPLFIDIAGGLDRVDCKRTTTLRTLAEVGEAIAFARDAECETIVIDEVGAFEELLIQNILETSGKSTLVDFGYGKGYEILCQKWMEWMGGFDRIRRSGKNIILVGHDVVEKFQDPLREDYDRYSINIHKKSVTPVVGRMDAVLFAEFEAIVKDRESKNKKRAIGGDRRIVHTVNNPAFIAKNRFNLPAEEEFAPSFWSKLN